MRTPQPQGAAAIEAAIRSPKRRGQPALVAFLTGGFPDLETFRRDLVTASRYADVVEIGVPFRDPMADGPVLQHAAHQALDGGASLEVLLDILDEFGPEGESQLGRLEAPVLLMGYANPFFRYGFERLADRLADPLEGAGRPAGTGRPEGAGRPGGAGRPTGDGQTNGKPGGRRSTVAGLLIPDLPLEESEELRVLCEDRGLALPQLVPPTATTSRIQDLCNASRGFVYAVTARGTTGAAGRPSATASGVPPEALEFEAVTHHLDRVRRGAAGSNTPICAGFGIRDANTVRTLAPLVDGVIVGTALVDAIGRGIPADTFLQTLMTQEVSIP